MVPSLPSSGSPAGPLIQLVRYDPEWAAKFTEEAAALHDCIGPWITGGIHHVGSTAVPGLAAKPIIDIQVGVADLESSKRLIDDLAPLGYCYAPYRAEVMHWFCKPRPERRTHHLHLVPTDSPRFLDVLAFRDYLRTHPQEAASYGALKVELAFRRGNDRERYTEGKTALVQQLTAEARDWRTNA